MSITYDIMGEATCQAANGKGKGLHERLVSTREKTSGPLSISILMIPVVGIGPLPTCFADYNNQMEHPKMQSSAYAYDALRARYNSRPRPMPSAA